MSLHCASWYNKLIPYSLSCKAEAVTESLKNTLLVMSASHVLRPGSYASQLQDMVLTSYEADGDSKSMWDLTWSKIGAFCPTVKNEFYAILNKVLSFFLSFVLFCFLFFWSYHVWPNLTPADKPTTTLGRGRSATAIIHNQLKSMMS